jgi:hypothetical protein
VTRPSLSEILSGEELGLQEVWSWYAFQRALIGEEKSRVLGAPAGDLGLATSRYVGKTREEVEGDFAYQIAELAQVAKLGMLASTEAALRIDSIERVLNRKRDAVSRRFLDINGGRWWKPFSRRGIHNARLDEDILNTWRDHGPDPDIRHVVSEFKGVLKLRHWLAHGRYWKPRLGRASYDILDVFEICRQLLQAVGLTP